MEAVRCAVAFDSGIWVTSNVVSDGFNSAYLFNQPPEMMENYNRTIRISGDSLAQAVVSSPGRTVNSNDVMLHDEFIRHPTYLQHCRYFGMEYALSTCHILPVTGIVSAIAFYRSDPDAPFTESERQAKELLVNGKTYKAIARELTITPSTVTKHVNEIHARLKIDSREALIGFFRQRQGYLK